MAKLAKDSGLPEESISKAAEVLGLPENKEYLTGTNKTFGHPKSKMKIVKAGAKGYTKDGINFAKALGLLDKNLEISKLSKTDPQIEDIKSKVATAVNIYNNIFVKAYSDVLELSNRNVKARQALTARAGGRYQSPARFKAAAYNSLKSSCTKEESTFIKQWLC